MTDIVTCAICGWDFDIKAGGGFTNNMTGKSVCDACTRKRPDETVMLMVERS